jgi:hypothetical protein
MNGDEVVEFESAFAKATADKLKRACSEMPETRQHFFYFFTKFSISGVFLSAVF